MVGNKGDCLQKFNHAAVLKIIGKLAQFKNIFPAPFANVRAIVDICLITNIFNDFIKKLR